MFYQPGVTDHGLPYDPYKACVIPRPIGWISTVGPAPAHAANLAPFSQFNNLTFDPPYVMFAANHVDAVTHKDTVRNAEATGVFCWQLATYELRESVNVSAQQLDYGVDEFEVCGLEKTWSRTLKTSVPMVKRSPVRFECEYYCTMRLPGNPPVGSVDVVVGRVVGVHIDDGVLTKEGKIDVAKTMPIARCGYYDYAVVKETFEMVIPGADRGILSGLEGSVRANREAGTKATGESGESEVSGRRA